MDVALFLLMIATSVLLGIRWGYGAASAREQYRWFE